MFYYLEVWKDAAAVIFTEDFNFGKKTAELVCLNVVGTAGTPLPPLAECLHSLKLKFLASLCYKNRLT